MPLRLVKGGCRITSSSKLELITRLDTIAGTIKELLTEVDIKGSEYTNELDAELKQAKTKLHKLLRYIRDIKANNKITMKGKVKDTKFADLRDYS